jgi:hypothetical protein
MQINYPDYFTALGFGEKYYEPASNKFDSGEIIEAVEAIINNWKKKYPKLEFKTQNLKFDTLTNFNHTYTSEIEFLNFDVK